LTNEEEEYSHYLNKKNFKYFYSWQVGGAINFHVTLQQLKNPLSWTLNNLVASYNTIQPVLLSYDLYVRENNQGNNGFTEKIKLQSNEE